MYKNILCIITMIIIIIIIIAIINSINIIVIAAAVIVVIFLHLFILWEFLCCICLHQMWMCAHTCISLSVERKENK